MATTQTPARLKIRYAEEILPALVERFGYTTPMQAPATSPTSSPYATTPTPVSPAGTWLAPRVMTATASAQPTTFGRRVCLWIQDLLLDLERRERRHQRVDLDLVVGDVGDCINR